MYAFNDNNNNNNKMLIILSLIFHLQGKYNNLYSIKKFQI